MVYCVLLRGISNISSKRLKVNRMDKVIGTPVSVKGYWCLYSLMLYVSILSSSWFWQTDTSMEILTSVFSDGCESGLTAGPVAWLLIEAETKHLTC